MGRAGESVVVVSAWCLCVSVYESVYVYASVYGHVRGACEVQIKYIHCIVQNIDILAADQLPHMHDSHQQFYLKAGLIRPSFSVVNLPLLISLHKIS